MLREFVWKIFASLTNMKYDKEYAEAARLSSRVLLTDLLFHAYNNVPFYHKTLKNSGVIENGKIDLSNFEKIPILSRELLKKRANELISKDFHKRNWFYNTSSGSTGEPTRFIQDRVFSKWILTTSKYYYENILGLNEAFAKKLLLWAIPTDSRGLSFGLAGTKINNFLTHTRFQDPLYMTENDMEKCVKILNSYKPTIVRGYSGALYEIAKFVKKKKLTVHKPTAVISSAETLEPHMRTLIENIFGVKVFDFYGSRECDGIAGECRCGLFHTFTFNNYVEILDIEGKKVKEGESGKAIVTNLHNYSMPLIRYDIGDMVTSGPKKCQCGASSPTLEKIMGRIACFFKKQDGTIIEPFFFGRLLQKQWIKAYCVIQEDYNKIKLSVVPLSRTIDASEKRDIDQNITRAMGKDCIVEWDIVDEIPKSRAGKRIPYKCLIS